jgi:cell division protein FtsI (penicillin-binding protein 3)
MEGALRLMDVPPDHVEQWYAAQAKPGASSTTAVPGPGAGALLSADAVPVAPPAEAEDDGAMQQVQP